MSYITFAFNYIQIHYLYICIYLILPEYSCTIHIKSSHYSMSSNSQLLIGCVVKTLGYIIVTTMFYTIHLMALFFSPLHQKHMKPNFVYVPIYFPAVRLGQRVARVMRVYQEAFPMTNCLIGGVWSQHCFKFILRKSFNEWNVGSVIN